jgi:arginine:pyruvate transaminase
MARSLSELAGRVAAASPPGWEICGAARARIAAGEDIVMMGPGVPDLAAPESAIRACRDSLAMGRTRYPDPLGDPALRAALAGRHARRTGTPVDPSDVVVTAGAQAGLLACVLALASPGTGIGIPVPAYPAYRSAAAAAGARFVPIPLGPAPGYALDLSGVRGADIGLVVLTTPHNPTGRVFSRREVEGLAALCRDGDLWLVSDEVYAGHVYEGEHIPPASLPGMPERTFTVGSFSKSHAMSGFRCGWVVAPPGLGSALRTVIACGSLGVPPFVQDAALAALRDDGACEAASRTEYAGRRHALVSSLRQGTNLVLAAPEGGMFAMVGVGRAGFEGSRFAWDLLDRGVCVIPGGAFGAGGEGFVRVALTETATRIRSACERMAELAGGRSRCVRGGGLASSDPKGIPCPTPLASAPS